jgi:hypothetical protein
MWIYDEARCVVECGGSISVEIGPVVIEHRASIDAQVQIEVKRIELAVLGAFLGRHAEVEGLMIPATDAGRMVDLSEEYTTVRAVIERTGLVVAGPGPG